MACGGCAKRRELAEARRAAKEQRLAEREAAKQQQALKASASQSK